MEAVFGPKSLGTEPLLLELGLALPGKLSGPYTELTAAFEIVPNVTHLLGRKDHEIRDFGPIRWDRSGPYGTRPVGNIALEGSRPTGGTTVGKEPML